MGISNKKNEFIYFAFRNVKLIVGLCIFTVFLFIALMGIFFKPYATDEYAGPGIRPPSKEFLLGTTIYGQDVFSQCIEGIQAAFFVGFIGGGIATFLGLLIGFFAGYKGGILDEILMMMTNIFLVMPTLVLLIVLAAYLPYRGILIESLIIGVTAWPWTARAVRSHTFSLRTHQFVDLARISGRSSFHIIVGEIAPNMFSYVVMVLILQISGAIMIAAGLDFIGLGPTKGITLGLMMSMAVRETALILGMWWWAIPPGLAITLIVSSLYLMNTGLDEVFNPKLREL